MSSRATDAGVVAPAAQGLQPDPLVCLVCGALRLQAHHGPRHVPCRYLCTTPATCHGRGARTSLRDVLCVVAPQPATVFGGPQMRDASQGRGNARNVDLATKQVELDVAFLRPVFIPATVHLDIRVSRAPARIAVARSMLTATCTHTDVTSTGSTASDGRQCNRRSTGAVRAYPGFWDARVR